MSGMTAGMSATRRGWLGGVRGTAVLMLALLAGRGGVLHAAEATWTSARLGRALAVDVLAPLGADEEEAALAGRRPSAPPPLAIYLRGLATPRVGQVDDAELIAELRAAGLRVAVVDFAGDARAAGPGLHRDLGQLRDDLQAKRWLADVRYDAARVFLVPAGCRLRRNVVFYLDAQARRTLAMDVVFPAEPVVPVPAMLEFSCDNRDRMGNYSLSVCSDTLLDGLAAHGFAVAMADHPVAPPYKGLDPMPESAWKIKAAVRTLRAEGVAFGLSGKIGVAGFSRGSGMALMLVTTEGRDEFEGRGEHAGAGVSSAVQAAVVLSGRFTYLDLRADDAMIPRYVQAWGDPREAQAGRAARARERWRAHGALDHLATAPRVPLWLSINATESPEALHQMEVLRRRLTEFGAEFTYAPEETPRGHKVPLDAGVLAQMHAYLDTQLR